MPVSIHKTRKKSTPLLKATLKVNFWNVLIIDYAHAFHSFPEPVDISSAIAARILALDAVPNILIGSLL